MHKKYTIFSLMIICASLSACTLSATKVTQVSQNNPSYTAAAATINAQLTVFALPNSTAIAVDAQALPITTAAAELAPTGTALAATVDSALLGTLPVETTPPPSATPLATETPNITETPQTSAQTPTPVSTQNPRFALGDPDWRDFFDDGDNWPIFNDDHVQMQIVDGALEMKSLYTDKWESWMLTTDILEDFYLELEAVPGECAGYDRYGLLARAPSENQGYLFGFTCDGQYSIRIWNGRNFYMVTPWTASDKILKGPDQTNILGFWAQGNTLRVYANGEFLTEVQDTNFSSGGFGIYSSAFNTPGFTTLFKEMSYWVLP